MQVLELIRYLEVKLEFMRNHLRGLFMILSNIFDGTQGLL